MSVVSVNCIKSPCCKNLEVSPPNPLHSINFLPSSPLNVKSVTDLTSAYFSLLTSISAVYLLALPEPNSQKNDLTFCGVYVTTESLARIGITTAPEPAPPLGLTTVTIGGLEYSTFTRSLFTISALMTAFPDRVKLIFDIS